MLTPAEAEQKIPEHIAPFPREDCPLGSAHRRVLRAEVRADRDLPPFDRVTMDGFALRAAALAAGVRTFRIDGTQAAGMRAFSLGSAPDVCIEIMTGAVLPDGADCVVPYEDTQRKGTTMTIRDEAARLAAGNAIHRKGSDHRAGEVLIRPGTRITGREIAVAAACGYGTLTVSQQPRIAVVASGDELVEVEAPVSAHQIRRSNDHAIRAALQSAGYPAVSRFHFRDLQSEIEQSLRPLLTEFDVVVLTGGVSKGKFDYLPAELERQGVKKLFHGVAQRPGKPLWVGISQRQTPVFALPGNPVSAYTCLHRYVLPALARASGLPAETPPLAALAAPLRFKPKLAHLVPVRLSSGPAGELLATPDATNTSGDFGGLLGTDGFVELPAEPGDYAAGTLAPYRPWV